MRVSQKTVMKTWKTTTRCRSLRWRRKKKSRTKLTMWVDFINSSIYICHLFISCFHVWQLMIAGVLEVMALFGNNVCSKILTTFLLQLIHCVIIFDYSTYIANFRNVITFNCYSIITMKFPISGFPGNNLCYFKKKIFKLTVGIEPRSPHCAV